MPKDISIEGPVELVDGKLMLRIPLDEGGAELASVAKAVSTIEDDEFVFVIKPWLAEKLRIGDGSRVFVNNHNGKFTIIRSAANDLPASDDA